MKRRFIQCDVFTAIATRGNGLAVVVDGEGLSEAQMQGFAAWTNLAETTFLFPPDDAETADYKVRILTPAREMPFAGHPTLGSCAAWLRTGGRPLSADIVRQQCGVGIVEIDIGSKIPAFVAPPTKSEPLAQDVLQKILARLELDPARVVRSARLDNGPVWQVLELINAQDVLACDAATVRWPDYKGIGLLGAHDADAECDYEVRMLAPSSGMSEDPITGSLNSAIACWMQAEGRLPGPLLISQGVSIGRNGRVHIVPRRNGSDKIYIGGETQIVIEGLVEL